MVKKIGLTGSIGTGKSCVSQYLKQRGIAVIDADQIVRELYLEENFCKKIAELFGAEVLDQEGKIDKKKLAAQVFGRDELRKKLNNIVHPLVRKTLLEESERYKEEEMVLYDIPLLFETGMDSLVDLKVVVVADKDRVRTRVHLRDGRPMEEIERIFSSQLSQEQKIERADFVIENNSSLEELYIKADELIEKIKEIEIQGERD